MNNDSKEEKFEYTYSAPTEQERREIEYIKKQYEPKKTADSNIECLRKLDNKVKRAPEAISLILGIAGVLILGLGMTMILEWEIMLWGVIVGVVGLALAAAAYPIYNAILKINKKKYAEEIIRLSNEILNKDEENEDK